MLVFTRMLEGCRRCAIMSLVKSGEAVLCAEPTPAYKHTFEDEPFLLLRSCARWSLLRRSLARLCSR